MVNVFPEPVCPLQKQKMKLMRNCCTHKLCKVAALENIEVLH